MSKIYNSGETEEELRNKYNPEGSERRIAQKKLLEMLIWFDNVCKENNIQYYLSDGALLGAYRHKGFIPWDDDIDVSILRKEYKKLKKILESDKYKSAQYVLQTHKSDKGFFGFYPVLRDTKSEYILDSIIHKERKYRGLQIDIFTYNDNIIHVLQKFCYFFERVNIKFFIGRHKILATICYWIECLIIIPFSRFISLLNFNHKYIQNDYACYWTYKYLEKEIFPLKTIEFEGYSFPCPGNLNYYLEKTYGKNYMELPNINDRDNHKIIEIKYFI